jgi:hypothetical protein
MKTGSPFDWRVKKPYSEMTPKQKLEYKRWLLKHNFWDGQEVLERLQEEKRLNHIERNW